ncbi:MAG: hypothetical protein ABFS34_11695 [Gemmatimonadota bacterium]
MELAVGLVVAGLVLAFVALPVVRRARAPGPAEERALDRLVDHAARALAEGAVCARCYAVNRAEDRFCATCGRPLSGAGRPRTRTESAG